MHLAEVLAATESTEVSRLPQGSDTAGAGGTGASPAPVTGGGVAMSATFVGMPAFPEAARAALGNTQLRQNLAHATGTIRGKRAAVVAEVDDWEELRLAGAEIKDRTLRHLDEYLLQLEASLQARGVTVHWARDAQEACAVVAGIAKGHGVDEVVKVKSMATQEINLNEALAAEGIAAWETDLAELIVQLGDDLPSHILVPAIHRNRSEVREIFRTRMASAGRPAPEGLTDEPRDLAAAARLHLREKFLRAKVAVSGANFAVAETGTLVVVESEGNGRMCLTLPEVLVSVVGIEKLVPTWQDLDVFLQLLPRSSTGERMNPYTSMWSGVTPGDGPQELHVVLLDNGRTNVLADEVGRQALRCIRCSACLNVCPVYERTGGHAYGSVYPGPIGAILNPLLKGVGVDEQTDSLPYASTLCGACFEVCPVRIDIPEVLVHLRGKVVDAHRSGRPKGQDLAMRAAAWVLGDARRTAVAELAAGLSGRVVSAVGRRTLPGGRTAIGRLPWPGLAVDRCPRPALASPGVVPGLVAAHGRRPPRRRGGGPVNARDEVLARVRRALGDAERTPESPLPSRVRADHRSHAEVLDLFAERVADYRATVVRCAEDEVAGAVASALSGAGSVVVPDGFPADWLAAGEPDGVRRVRGQRTSRRPTLDRVDGGRLDGGRRHRRDRHHRARPRPRAGPSSPQPGARPARLRGPVGAGGGRRARCRRRPRPRPAADLGERPERDQRHRARPGRGGARATDPARHPGRRLARARRLRREAAGPHRRV